MFTMYSFTMHPNGSHFGAQFALWRLCTEMAAVGMVKGCMQMLAIYFPNKNNIIANMGCRLSRNSVEKEVVDIY